MTSLSSRQVALFVLTFISLASSAIALNMLDYGSKVREHDIDEGRPLSPFYIAPEFTFLDLNGNVIPDPDEPVYIHIDPTMSRVSENDVRITSFGDNSSPVTFFPAGSKVKATEPDHDKELRKFGAWHTPAAELTYFDVNGDKAYSIDDPVYLEFNQGFITAGDVRIDGYDNCSPGSRVRDSDPDSGKPTSTLPGMLCFYNADGDIDNAGWAIYGAEDSIYLDTQYPFYAITPNDIRMNGYA